MFLNELKQELNMNETLNLKKRKSKDEDNETSNDDIPSDPGSGNLGSDHETPHVPAIKRRINYLLNVVTYSFPAKRSHKPSLHSCTTNYYYHDNDNDGNTR